MEPRGAFASSYNGNGQLSAARTDGALAMPTPVTASWSAVPTQASAAPVLFNFDNAVLHSPLPIDLTEGGITAHFSATGQGFSIQQANVLGFTPAGFSGYCLYPNSVFPADLLVSFSQTLVDFSILYAPEEYATDSSATMRVTAYMDGALVGTNTATANPPGTWPTATLSFAASSGFNNVVVHYDSPPPTGGDYGPIFMADNMSVTPAPPCFCRGTLIRTALGAVPVEALAIGDRVATQSGEMRPIKWIGKRAYDGRFIAGNRDILPIRIEAGALAGATPARDLLLSPEHALVLDGLLVPAGLLVNGATIRQVDKIDPLEYFHIELDTHDVIYANGAAAETFVDCDNRATFQNGHEFAALYPDGERAPWRFCAPRVGSGSPELAAVRAKLLARAMRQNRVTRDPNLHLVADGRVIGPMAVVGQVYCFLVPAGVHDVVITSRAAVPAETEAASGDRRILGVAVEQVVMESAGLRIAIAAGCPALRDGFHDSEGPHRWTNGCGRLPTGIAAYADGDISVEIRIAESELRYAVEAPSAVTAVAQRAPGRVLARRRRQRA